MSSSQRQTRRKTTRHLFDDDDEPPAKRSKVESVPIANGTSKPTAPKGAGVKAKKQRIAYDEDADGFQFTRKTRSKKSSDEPTPVNEIHSSTAKSRPVVVKAKAKTDSLLISTSSEPEAGQRRRRSARLSGDKEEVVQILPSEKPKRKRKSNEPVLPTLDRKASPVLVQTQQIQVEKKREGTKIALPFADTPVINRNKEMRAGKSKAAQHRRSSVTSRGRRASSLIESGTSNGRTPLRTYGRSTPKSASKLVSFASMISDSSLQPSTPQLQLPAQDLPTIPSDSVDNFLEPFLANDSDYTAVPHADVDVKDFYKHIEHSLLEPKRMKQLLTWTATRALPSKSHGGNGNSSEIFTIEASRQIIEDLLKDFANKPDMSDWFSRQDDGERAEKTAAIVKKPNPRNRMNLVRLKQLEGEIERLKEEERQWSALMSPIPLPGQQEEDNATAEDLLGDIDTAALDPEQAAILAALKESSIKPPTTSNNEADAQEHASLEDISTRLRRINQTLEPTVDVFADGIHRIGQYRLAAERVADAVLGKTARAMEIREKEGGDGGVDARDVLSALSSALTNAR